MTERSKQLAYGIVGDLIEKALQSPERINFSGCDRVAVTAELELIRLAMVGAWCAVEESRRSPLHGVCKCGAPDDGHWPDCQPASQGGTVRDMVAS